MSTQVKARVLIADDDARFTRAVRITLEAEGLAVDVARDGYQAVEFARRYAPDLMLLDVHMPAGDGFSVEDRLRRLPGSSPCPIVYVTGDRVVAQSIQSRLGVERALLKPFEKEDLLCAVWSALGDGAACEDAALARRQSNVQGTVRHA